MEHQGKLSSADKKKIEAQEKRKVILDAGYNLTEIWESDWVQLNKKLKKE